MEAEAEARKVVKESLAHFGQASPVTGNGLKLLTRVLLAQGRTEEAQKLSDAAFQVIESAGTPYDSSIAGDARVLKGDILAVRGDYEGAMQQYDLAREGMKENRFLYEKSFMQDPLITLSMLMSGRSGEALEAASRNYENFRKSFGEKHEKTARALSLRGMAQKRLGTLKEACQDLSAGTDVLITQKAAQGEFSYLANFRKIVIDDYIELLSKIRGTPLEKELGIDAVSTAFKLAEANRGRSVQGAVVASSARAAVTDPQLADLIRKGQDAERRILTIENTISDLLSAPDSHQYTSSIEKMKGEAESLGRARSSILTEIKRRFPKYADLVNPPPCTIGSIQQLLKPAEVFISIYSTRDHTFVWAIPSKGEVVFASAPIGKEGLSTIVAKIRGSLDPKPETLGDIPDFDVSPGLWSLREDIFTH